jgi:hypothetical protein
MTHAYHCSLPPPFFRARVITGPCCTAASLGTPATRRTPTVRPYLANLPFLRCCLFTPSQRLLWFGHNSCVVVLLHAAKCPAYVQGQSSCQRKKASFFLQAHGSHAQTLRQNSTVVCTTYIRQSAAAVGYYIAHVHTRCNHRPSVIRTCPCMPSKLRLLP